VIKPILTFPFTESLKDFPLEELIYREERTPVPKYVTIAAHLRVDELEHRYRKAANTIERSHFQLIWLLAQGKRINEVAEVTGYCANWIRILARRYNQDGPQALVDQRHQNTGAPSLLSKEHQEQLQYALEAAVPDGGLWTGPKVAGWMSEQIGRKVYP
jgi:transposase